ncbi:uncharacterized protein [Epargyreus clarus]|uniref:uncharacterized protein n=1 Tax=Epargyreus clarus TaxID=520877 RepID=UPI003C2ED31F
MMNMDKENINRIQTKSKIPLPLDPLPAISGHVFKKRRNSETEYRHPLKTINNQQTNLTGSVGSSKKTKRVLNTAAQPLKLDTRHVTLRQASEDLDWDYNVFKDKSEEENSVISISDDEDNIENNRREVQYFADNIQRNCLGDAKKNATPVLNSLEHSRIKNIKRSLKRPHSRELQGLSSVLIQDRKEDEKHKRRLNFNERLHERLQSPDFFKRLYMTCLSRDYISDMYMYLLSAEKKTIVPRIPSITRACVINWLLKVNGADGDPTIVQTACWYLDAVLGIGHVQLDKLQLVAAACFWISQKLHGPSVQASRLVKCANRAFTGEQLMAAEKAVLYKLRFPRQPVVPQDYITYLSWWCDSSHPGEIEVAATFLCLSGLMVDKALCDEYPSVVGAAAVRNALLLLKKKDAMMRFVVCPVFKEIEKKAQSMSFVSSVQRKAVRLMFVPSYEYKAPFEHYSCRPYYIAQRVVKAANELGMDSRLQPGTSG